MERGAGSGKLIDIQGPVCLSFNRFGLTFMLASRKKDSDSHCKHGCMQIGLCVPRCVRCVDVYMHVIGHKWYILDSRINVCVCE